MHNDKDFIIHVYSSPISVATFFFTLHWIIVHNFVNLHIMSDEQWKLGQKQEQNEEDAKDWDTCPGQCGLGKILGYLPVDVKPKEYEKQKMNSYNIQRKCIAEITPEEKIKQWIFKTQRQNYTRFVSFLFNHVYR